MANLNFDASQVAPAQALDAIPSGWYPTMATASEMKPNSSGTGSYLEIEHTVFEGEYKGRKIFDRLNLQNPNPTAVEIAYKTLSAICHAVGVIQVQDSSQLHNRPMMTKVAMKPPGVGADGVHRDATNEVKGYKAYAPQAQGVTPSAPPTQFAPPPPPAAAPQYAPPPAQFAPPPAPQFAAPPAQFVPPPAAAPAPQQWTPPAAPAAQPTPATPAAPPAVAAAADGSAPPPWAAAPAPAPAPQPAPAPVPQPAAAPAPAPAQAAPVPPWMQGQQAQ